MLNGKVVLITGASGGLGRSVTNAFLNAGARVAGTAPGIRQADFPHPEFAAFPGEVNTSEAARLLVAQAVQTWGHPDVLVHLVGGFAGGATVAETDDSTLDRMLDINLRVAFHFVRAVLPGMQARNSGRILAIGSRAAIAPQPGVGAYAASKAALVSLIQTVALENKDRGIAANVILPGTMDTPANRRAMPDADFSRWVPPSQVADLLVHLASDQASAISGAVIPIPGGDL
jgi:NAD(P)-dependent dehydrogenase (short-subunit alcohol dehydrogenase family)